MNADLEKEKRKRKSNGGTTATRVREEEEKEEAFLSTDSGKRRGKMMHLWSQMDEDEHSAA
jgi:hypothetical protein